MMRRCNGRWKPSYEDGWTRCTTEPPTGPSRRRHPTRPPPDPVFRTNSLPTPVRATDEHVATVKTLAQRLQCAEGVRVSVDLAGLGFHQPSPGARDDLHRNVVGLERVLVLDPLERRERVEHLRASVGGLELECVEQQRQEPAPLFRSYQAAARGGPPRPGACARAAAGTASRNGSRPTAAMIMSRRCGSLTVSSSTSVHASAKSGLVDHPAI